jgi:hypothetical protein
MSRFPISVVAADCKDKKSQASKPQVTSRRSQATNPDLWPCVMIVRTIVLQRKCLTPWINKPAENIMPWFLVDWAVDLLSDHAAGVKHAWFEV